MASSMYILSAGLEFFFALVSVILLIGCLFDHDRGRDTNRIFVILLAFHAMMNTIDACVWLWGDVPELIALMKLLTFLSYTFGCVVFALFSYLVVCIVREATPVPGWIPKAIVALSSIMSLLWVISLFNGMYFYWDANGEYQIGKYYFVSQALGAVFLVFNIVFVLVYRKSLSRRDCCNLILYSLLPLASYAFVTMGNTVPLFMASTVSLLLYYTAIHLEHGQMMARQQALLMEQELELHSSRTAMMLSQIQPHFLYNTLTAIAQLCEKNPKKAKETTLYFSEYLRRNMRALEQTNPIPFEKELEHVKTYLAIEHVRFADELQVDFDIKTTDFSIPPLCLQPLVENAVKHGVGMKEDGGTVHIRTRELPDCYEITVEDDGVGFDPDKAPRDAKAHIGIQNVRERLQKMVDATLGITSVPGVGTTVTISIPRKG